VTVRRLLAIIELGGYPNLVPLYQRLGFQVDVVQSQRKARSYLKKTVPDVIVAEYNFQTDFRDRSSNLETLMAILQKCPETRLIVFYLERHAEKFAQFRERWPVFAAVAFPVTEDKVEQALQGVINPN
jgi:glucan phosphoethanolaminetransferase (alkaline phosphatase superfamily)